jgi:hypothetical protein
MYIRELQSLSAHMLRAWNVLEMHQKYKSKNLKGGYYREV